MGEVTERLQLRSGDRTTIATVSPGAVTIEGTAYQVDPVAPGVYRVTDADRSWLVTVAGAADERWVHIDGCVARVEVSSAEEARRPARRHVDEGMSAPMPATVVKLLVEPGATVNEGDTILVLEAMKMELPVRAPRAGVVTRVLCRSGELVQPGVPLVELQ